MGPLTISSLARFPAPLVAVQIVKVTGTSSIEKRPSAFEAEGRHSGAGALFE